MAQSRSMRLEEETVFVLGAGFTKAFVPDAPLLVDDYGGQEILNSLSSLPAASKVMEAELSLAPKGLVDLERVMTRLHSRMPYDAESEVTDEFGLLLTRLTDAFQERLRRARKAVVHWDDLMALAAVCAQRSISCITFNYDDVFDEALHRTKHVGRLEVDGLSVRPWNVDRGYGFFCKASAVVVGANPNIDVYPSKLQLLKLHGSVNWRVALGSQPPYQTENLVHHEQWTRSPVTPYPEQSDVEIHLEPRAVVIPPVLAKDRLLMEPFIRVVWARARELLRRARMVVIVGYSLPLTDIASRYLFSEAVSHSARIEIVNYTRNSNEEEALRAHFRQVFPELRYDQFHFGGALEWSQTLAKKYG